MPTFELLSRSGCHLCDEMEELLAEVLPRYGESYTIRDVDSNADWRRAFSDYVPVLLRDGKVVAKLRLGRDQLERIVRRKRPG